MLGRIPLVSMSDKRLGGIENSSFRYLSATRALEFSTSRMVRPSFSRSVRRLFPAGNIGPASKECGGIIPKAKRIRGKDLCKKFDPHHVLQNPNTRAASSSARSRGSSADNGQD